MNRRFCVLICLLITLTLSFSTASAAEKYDVLVIGAGGAGLSAAVEAADAGARVVVLEKMPMVGGNTMYATGGLNAAGTEFQKKKGIEDSQDLFFKDTMKGGHNLNDPELVKVLTARAKEAVEWLTTLGCDLSDVGSLGGASVPRAHRPTGGAAIGSIVVKALKSAADQRNVTIRTRTTATALLKNPDGSVAGVKVIDHSKQEHDLLAGSVIIAAGGFGASQEKIVRYQPHLKGFGTTNHKGATGDAVDIGKDFGVQFRDMEQIQTHPTVVPNKGIMITEAVRGNGAILVNRDGKRFIDELSTRDVVSAATLEQEGKTAFLIFDEGVRKSLKAIETYVKLKLITESATVEGLAAAIKIDPAVLNKTVADYNRAVEVGVDKDFKRNEMPCKLEKSNFYAVEVGPAVHHTMGGITINSDSQVIGAGGKPIPGLYACGEVTGGVHGGNRLGGNAQADIIVFGRIAGKKAASFAKTR